MRLPNHIGFLPAVALVALLWVALATPVEAQRQDVVVFQNGDRLIGEIKRLERGRLHFKTDAAETFPIDLEYVTRLTSPLTFQIELENGDFFFGSLVESSADGMLRMPFGEDGIELELEQVVRITRIKKSFWGKVDGSLSAGFSFTQASGVLQLNYAFDAAYRSRRNIYSLDSSTITTIKREDPTTNRQMANFSYRRLRKHRYFIDGLTRAERNDELGIDLRVSVGGGGGRAMIKTNHSLLALSLGLVANNETAAGTGETLASLEASLSMGYELFKYSSPKTDIRTELSLLPSLTQSGRLRGRLDVNLRWEMIKDFFWNLSGYVDYDNQPPETAERGSDYGIVFSMGWSF